MHFDIAAKVILSHCRNTALEYFLGITPVESQILELPQETTTLRRADFPMRVTDKKGRKNIILLEIQSRWEKDLLLRVLEYDVRYRLRYHLPVVPCVLLLTGHGKEPDHFESESIRYKLRLIKIWEMDAEEMMESDNPCMMPFVPLMKGGSAYLESAEQKLYTSDLPRGEKGDLLTGMALLSGLVSEEFPKILLERRRDIIMESAAYEIIKKEGFDEGVQMGIQTGIQTGIQQGMREMVLSALEERFGPVNKKIAEKLKDVESGGVLKVLLRNAMKVESAGKFRDILEQMNI